ncbi:MAG: CPBP family intramembrane metalloprotease [Oscillospiraceae bacterium]|nr:CPBP family intramembrane metalloprotease [Oscillospiraceae bacterium]
MTNAKITDNKKACLILAFIFWGLLVFFEFAGDVLLELFSRELLLKYSDPIFYGTFFILTAIIFRKALLDSAKDFNKNTEKYLKVSAIFFVIALVLMVGSAIFLDSVGIGESSNEQAVNSSLEKYGFLHIIITCMIGPFVEEIFYRGILFRFIKGNGNSTVRAILAVALTALIFMFNHVNYSSFNVADLLANVPIGMLGLSLGALYWKTDNIFCPILVHVAMNSIATFG